MWQSPRPSTARANQKPWLTAEVCGMLKTWDLFYIFVLRPGDKASLRDNLSHGINKAKQFYAKKKKLINHSDHYDDETSLPDALNHFYARFEMQNYILAWKRPSLPNEQVICLSSFNVRKTLSRINPCKAGSPDNIPGHVLRDCAEQLTDVLTDIFNTSLSQAVILTCLITTTSTKEVIHDYFPIALNRIMKYFERLVMHHIKSSLPNKLYLLQVAYCPNHSTDNVISSSLHNSSSITWTWWASTPQHH